MNTTVISSIEQQKETLKRSVAYKAGKIKGHTLSEVRKRIKKKL